MMKTKKQLAACVLSFALLFNMIPTVEVSAAKRVSLNTKKLTVAKGTSKTLKVKNTKKKVTWKILSGKKCITLKKKGKTAVAVKGRKKGTAKVQAKIGKKKLVCKVTVKNVKKPGNTPKQTQKPDTMPSASAKPAITAQPTGTQTPPTITEQPTGTQAPPTVTEQPTGTQTPPTITEQPTGTQAPPTTTGQPTGTQTPPTVTEQPTGTQAPPTTTGQPTGTQTPPTVTEQPAGTQAPPTTTEQPTGTQTPPTATEQPTGSQTPSATNEPTEPPADSRDEKDVTALKTLIAEQRERGATVSEDLDSKEYTWENGRLCGISWSHKSLSGNTRNDRHFSRCKKRTPGYLCGS